MDKENIHELLGYEKIKIIQNDDMFSFSLDSMLLADFIETKDAKKIIDLGTGNAPIPLFLTLKTNALLYGVEIQEEIANLAKRSIELNNLENRITIIQSDLKGIYSKLGANEFDIVCSNPPYFKNQESIENKNTYLTIARHEVKVTIEEIIIEASKLLKNAGKLYLIHRVERMPEIISLLEKYHFGLKKMRLIYPKPQKDANMFLIEAKLNRKSDLRIVSPLFVYDIEGKYTKEVLNIFNYKKEE